MRLFYILIKAHPHISDIDKAHTDNQLINAHLQLKSGLI